MSETDLNVDLRAHRSIETSDYPVTTFWRRAVAVFLDGVFSIPIILVLTVIFTKFGVPYKDIVANILFIILYHYIPLKKFGQTLGKKILGIKVIKMSGNDLSFKDVILRETVGKIISSIVLFIGYLRVLWATDRLAWHDKIASTKVIDVR